MLCVDCDAPTLSERCDECLTEVKESPNWRGRLPRARRTRTERMRASDAPCLRCGGLFETKRPSLAKYCSTGCRVAASNDRAGADGRYERALAEAREANRQRNLGRTCVVCNGIFDAGSSKARYCSRRCSSKAQRAAAALRGGCEFPGCGHGVLAKGLCSTHYARAFPDRGNYKPRACECCVKRYVPRQKAQRFCSVGCRNGDPGWVMSTDPAAERLRAQYREARRRRRAAIRRREPERFEDAEIYERDGWRCGICRRAVNKKLRWPHPRSASLDHIVPLSQEGEHTRANVRLAHLDCNVARSNRGGNEQLALIG